MYKIDKYLNYIYVVALNFLSDHLRV